MELHVIGELVGGKGFGDGNATMCKWQMIQGDGWGLLEGISEGQTQVDCPVSGDETVWCHPIDLHYRTTSLAGWPRIRLQVWHHDQYGRNEIFGYGMCYVPTSPGMHLVEVSTWRPKGTFFEELTAFFLGGAPRLVDENLVSAPSERRGLRTVSSGTVKIRFAIILKDHEKAGLN